MADSHWGDEGLRVPFLAVLLTIAIGAGVVGLFFWSPWSKPSEAEWLTSYRSWYDEFGAALAAGRPACERNFDDQVGNPPTERLKPVAVAARRGCTALSEAGWRRAKADVVRALLAAHAAEVPPARRRALSRIVASFVGAAPDVYCWQPEPWASFSEHDAIVRGGDEATLQGVADRALDRIDLHPGVCAELARYVQRIRPTALSSENLDLADVLVVLAHEAEHLRRPSAPEAAIECYAMQHIRPLVAAAGWGDAFANEIALHGWEISYPRLPARFRTSRCRDGGPFDLHPSTTAWP